MNIVERVDAELAARRTWRAKEILRGAIRTGFDPYLFERYGRLLDDLGDRVEAGKYLFLSGARSAEYAEAIELFLHRNRRRARRDFARQLPNSVRRTPFASLPPAVQEDLRQRGVTAGMLDRTSRLQSTAGPVATRFGNVAAACVVFVLLAALAVGLIQIVKWVAALVSGG